MNSDTKSINRASSAATGFVVAGLIFTVLVLVVRFVVSVPAIDADRAAVRTKALAEIRATETQALNHPGWIDENRGLVRLPIDVAMQITEREWQDPAAARSNLTARVEKAAGPAPKAPEKPSAFE